MCGIFGAFNIDPSRPADLQTLRRMGEVLAHRGPDGGGLHTDGALGIGMRRLSIIDLKTGNQPLANEDGSIWVVFNGEIYNYRELTAELLAKGHRFATASDTEVLVHLYEEYGEAGVERLRGMFAFAIWDHSRRTLFLARDRLGIKPLYYAETPKGFVFASELKAVVQNPWARRSRRSPWDSGRRATTNCPTHARSPSGTRRSTTSCSSVHKTSGCWTTFCGPSTNRSPMRRRSRRTWCRAWPDST